MRAIQKQYLHILQDNKQAKLNYRNVNAMQKRNVCIYLKSKKKNEKDHTKYMYNV